MLAVLIHFLPLSALLLDPAKADYGCVGPSSESIIKQIRADNRHTGEKLKYPADEYRRMYSRSDRLMSVTSGLG